MEPERVDVQPPTTEACRWVEPFTEVTEPLGDACSAQRLVLMYEPEKLEPDEEMDDGGLRKSSKPFELRGYEVGTEVSVKEENASPAWKGPPPVGALMELERQQLPLLLAPLLSGGVSKST